MFDAFKLCFSSLSPTTGLLVGGLPGGRQAAAAVQGAAPGASVAERPGRARAWCELPMPALLDGDFLRVPIKKWWQPFPLVGLLVLLASEGLELVFFLSRVTPLHAACLAWSVFLPFSSLFCGLFILF